MGRMSFLDKAKELLGKHDDKVDQALNKVGDAAKQKYGHDGQIDTATKFARERTGTGAAGLWIERRRHASSSKR